MHANVGSDCAPARSSRVEAPRPPPEKLSLINNAKGVKWLPYRCICGYKGKRPVSSKQDFKRKEGWSDKRLYITPGIGFKQNVIDCTEH